MCNNTDPSKSNKKNSPQLLYKKKLIQMISLMIFRLIQSNNRVTAESLRNSYKCFFGNRNQFSLLLKQIARVCHENSLYKESIYWYKEAIKSFSESINTKKKYHDGLTYLDSVLRNESRLTQINLLEAYICPKLDKKDEKEIGNCYLGLGRAYEKLEKLKECLDYYQEAFRIFRKYPEHAETLNYIGTKIANVKLKLGDSAVCLSMIFKEMSHQSSKEESERIQEDDLNS